MMNKQLCYNQYYGAWQQRNNGSTIYASSASENNQKILYRNLAFDSGSFSPTYHLLYENSLKSYLFLCISTVRAPQGVRPESAFAHAVQLLDPSDTADAYDAMQFDDFVRGEQKQLDAVALDPITLLCDGERPAFPVAETETLQLILYELIFGMIDGDGKITVRCGTEETWNRHFRPAAAFLLELLPKSDSRKLSVGMSATIMMESKIRLVADDVNDMAPSGLTVRLCSAQDGGLSLVDLRCRNRYHSLKREVCRCLADKWQTSDDKSDYYSGLKFFMDDYREHELLACLFFLYRNGWYIPSDSQFFFFDKWPYPPDDFAGLLAAFMLENSQQTTDYMLECDFPDPCGDKALYIARCLDALASQGKSDRAADALCDIFGKDTDLGYAVAAGITHREMLATDLSGMTAENFAAYVRDPAVFLFVEEHRETVLKMLREAVFSPDADGGNHANEALTLLREHKPEWCEEMKNRLLEAAAWETELVGLSEKADDPEEAVRCCLLLRNELGIPSEKMEEGIYRLFSQGKMPDTLVNQVCDRIFDRDVFKQMKKKRNGERSPEERMAELGFSLEEGRIPEKQMPEMLRKTLTDLNEYVQAGFLEKSELTGFLQKQIKELLEKSTYSEGYCTRFHDVIFSALVSMNGEDSTDNDVTRVLMKTLFNKRNFMNKPGEETTDAMLRSLLLESYWLDYLAVRLNLENPESSLWKTEMPFSRLVPLLSEEVLDAASQLTDEQLQQVIGYDGPEPGAKKDEIYYLACALRLLCQSDEPTLSPEEQTDGFAAVLFLSGFLSLDEALTERLRCLFPKLSDAVTGTQDDLRHQGADKLVTAVSDMMEELDIKWDKLAVLTENDVPRLREKVIKALDRLVGRSDDRVEYNTIAYDKAIDVSPLLPFDESDTSRQTDRETGATPYEKAASREDNAPVEVEASYEEDVSVEEGVSDKVDSSYEEEASVEGDASDEDGSTDEVDSSYEEASVKEDGSIEANTSDEKEVSYEKDAPGEEGTSDKVDSSYRESSVKDDGSIEGNASNEKEASYEEEDSVEGDASYEEGTTDEVDSSYEEEVSVEEDASYEEEVSVEGDASYEEEVSVEGIFSDDLGTNFDIVAFFQKKALIDTSASVDGDTSAKGNSSVKGKGSDEEEVADEACAFDENNCANLVVTGNNICRPNKPVVVRKKAPIKKDTSFKEKTPTTQSTSAEEAQENVGEGLYSIFMAFLLPSIIGFVGGVLLRTNSRFSVWMALMLLVVYSIVMAVAEVVRCFTKGQESDSFLKNTVISSMGLSLYLLLLFVFHLV